MLGIGGGVIRLPVMVYLLGIPTHIAIIIGSQIGVRLAKRTNADTLIKIMGFVILSIGLFIILRWFSI